MIGRSLILKTSSWKPVERTIRHSRLFRPLVRRFVAGDHLEDALPACQELLAKDLMVSLDYLGENVKSEEEALQAKTTYIEMLRAIDGLPEIRESKPKQTPPPAPVSAGRTSVAAALRAAEYIPSEALHAPVGTRVDFEEGTDPHKNRPTIAPDDFAAEKLNVSIKLTQCGFDQGDELAEKNYREVVRIAAEKSNFIRVDMESSEYTERTLKIVERVWRETPNTGTVLQAYLYRTDTDVERMIELGMRVRLVKGAYLEPTTVAYADKSKVDEAYVRQAKRLLEGGYYPAIATHDEKIINELRAFVADKNISKSRFEFQMLYGVRRDLQDSLRSEGFNMRVYVPFGDHWYPYFSRRLAERPANIMFIARSLFKG